MTENKELITIIVPVYKVEAYLNKCVESIRNQTYHNLEIILIDDGSPDDCPKLCDAFAKIDERIKVIHQKNGGLSSARNAGIDRATGHYIGFVDSDDYIDATMFERLYEGILAHTCDIAICNHYVVEGDKLLMEMPPVDQECLYKSKEAIKLLLEDKVIKSYAWDKLYKAELFRGVRYPVGRNYEDIATTYLLMEKAKSICQLQDFGYYYQIRESCISNNSNINKWHKNCRDIVISMIERYEYFAKKKEKELEELSLAKILPYIITYFKLGYRIKCHEDLDHYKQFLWKHQEEIGRNQYVLSKDKRLAHILTYAHWISSFVVHILELKNRFPITEKVTGKINRLRGKLIKYDFSLQQGKQVRIFLFELPCFDNLGDHAIAYAEKVFFERMCNEISGIQLIQVSGWDTVLAVRQLRKEKRDNDVFICQGGGNMGNLYGFGEEFRRTIMRTFPDHFILVFPQTIYFTEDKQGKRELEKSKKVYNNCSNLTLLARDELSYERMKKEFQCKIMPMVDVVTSIDATEYSSQRREGSILCLRSDMESALTEENKKKLRTICEQHFSKNVITDTVTRVDINEADREKALKAKWSMFGKTEVVVTDRLHGMIFSLITATPCIILGNNHHKVREAYKTFAKCDYLYYVDSVDEVESVLVRIKKTTLPSTKTSFNNDFKQLYHYILDKISI